MDTAPYSASPIPRCAGCGRLTTGGDLCPDCLGPVDHLRIAATNLMSETYRCRDVRIQIYRAVNGSFTTQALAVRTDADTVAGFFWTHGPTLKESFGALVDEILEESERLVEAVSAAQSAARKVRQR